MGKHSKNVTNAPTFRQSERERLDWGTQTQRVGSDSLKALSSCCICLHVAVDPVICGGGHLFCRECVVESLLAQKRLIDAQAARFDAAQQAQKKQKRSDAQLQLDADRDAFLAANASLAVASSTTTAAATSSGGSTTTASTADAMHASLKRKARDEDEKRGLNCFWAHQNAPEAPEEPVQAPPSSTTCPEGEHELKLKHLTSVLFKVADGSSDADVDRYECPSCLKRLKNGVACVVITACGHAICAPCNATQDGRCFVCEAKFKSKHVVPLHNPGTGFAGSGAKLEATKQGVQFIA
jgi:nitric oxide synthase-interacting protein